MWRWAWEWWNQQLDRFVEHRIRRASDRVHAGFTRWMAENADRE